MGSHFGANFGVNGAGLIEFPSCSFCYPKKWSVLWFCFGGRGVSFFLLFFKFFFEKLSQVAAFFRWVDWLKSHAALLGKEAVFINLDETFVARSWPQVRGNVVRPRLWFRRGCCPVAKAKLKSVRTAVTHVALVCHHTEIQAVLPPISIGNAAAFPVEELGLCTKPATVQFGRSKSSWNSVQHMQQIIQEIAAAFAPYPTLQPIVVLDAAPLHLHAAVLEQGMKSGVWLSCVPAGLTWLLQPLDTHVFGLYKAWLRNHYRALLAQGPVSVQQWLQLLVQGATTFLRKRRWRRAFESDGIIRDRKKLSSHLGDYAPETLLGDAVPVVFEPPTENDLQVMLPSGQRNQRTLWLHRPLGRKRYLFLKWSTKASKTKKAQQKIKSSSKDP